MNITNVIQVNLAQNFQNYLCLIIKKTKKIEKGDWTHKIAYVRLAWLHVPNT